MNGPIRISDRQKPLDEKSGKNSRHMLGRRRGAGLMYVVGLLLFISLFTAIIISSLRTGVYQMDSYSLQTKAYYLNNEATSAAVAALLIDEEELFNAMKSTTAPKTDTFTHLDGSVQVGVSTITLRKENHLYFNENKDFIAITVTTVIHDPRAESKDHSYTYESHSYVMAENSDVRLYNISPSDF